MTPREAIPRSWTDYLTDGTIGVGNDLATTTKKKSNPSSITVTQLVGRVYFTRLIVTWKTADPDVSEEMLNVVLSDLTDAMHRPRRTCLDASNEVFFATQLKRRFISVCPVDLIKGGSKIDYRGESMDSKSLLGNNYVNHFDDGIITLPVSDYVKADHRLVMRDRGSFTTSLGRAGEHGDTFDSGKLSVWAIDSGTGRIQADAAAVGFTSVPKPQRPGLTGPIGRRIGRIITRLNS